MAANLVFFSNTAECLDLQELYLSNLKAMLSFKIRARPAEAPWKTATAGSKPILKEADALHIKVQKATLHWEHAKKSIHFKSAVSHDGM